MYTSTLYREVYTLPASNKDWYGWKLDRISPSNFRRAVNNIYKKLVTDRLPGLPKNAEPTHGELSRLVGRHEHSKRYLDELLVSIDRVQGAPNIVGDVRRSAHLYPVRKLHDGGLQGELVFVDLK